MDKETKKFLDEILAKDESSLTEDDVAFLRARESYLSYDDKVRLERFLGGENTNFPEGLAEVLKKKVKDLSEEEVELIKANADILNPKAVKKFKDILK